MNSPASFINLLMCVCYHFNVFVCMCLQVHTVQAIPRRRSLL